MSAVFRYRVFGLSVYASQPIAGLALDATTANVTPANVATASPDVTLTVRLNALPASPRPGDVRFTSAAAHASGRPMLRLSQEHDGETHVLEHGSGLVCRIDRAGRTLTIDWPARLLEDPWEFVLGFALACLLQCRGSVCLHAAAVVGDGSATLLVGPPGTGKSTLAAGLLAHGWELMTDDVAALVRVDDVVQIQPGPATLRPREGSIDILRALRKGCVRWSPSAEAGCIEVDPIESGTYRKDGPVAIGRVCVLDPRPNHPEVTLEPIDAAEAVVSIIGDAWPTRIEDDRRRERELDIVSRLIAQAQVVRLAYAPESAAWLEQAASALAASVPPLLETSRRS